MQIRYFNILSMINILTLLSADAKSAILLRVPLLTKFEWYNFLMLHFPRWFCLVNGQLSVSLRRVKRSAICKFLCFCLFDIQHWSVSSQVLLFSSQKFFPLSFKEIQLSVNCYVVFLKMFPSDVNRLTLPRLHFWAYFLKCFSI